MNQLESHDALAVPQPPARPWPRSRLLNVWVDDLTMEQLIERLDEGVVMTVNPHHLYHLQRNRAFYDAYREADFVTCDSRYLYWVLRLTGKGIQQHVSGSDIVPTFCWQHRNRTDTRIFLLGGATGVAQKARKRINAKVGRELVVAAHSPSMSFIQDDAEIATTLEMISRSGANVLFVGLGAPKQEIWIARYRHAIPTVKVFMGVGATIDYEADVVKRAPPILRRMGLEWLYRITTEPGRYLMRYVRDVEVVWLLAADLVGLYKSPWRHAKVTDVAVGLTARKA